MKKKIIIWLRVRFNYVVVNMSNLWNYSRKVYKYKRALKN